MNTLEIHLIQPDSLQTQQPSLKNTAIWLKKNPAIVQQNRICELTDREGLQHIILNLRNGFTHDQWGKCVCVIKMPEMEPPIDFLLWVSFLALSK